MSRSRHPDDDARLDPLRRCRSDLSAKADRLQRIADANPDHPQAPQLRERASRIRNLSLMSAGLLAVARHFGADDRDNGSEAEAAEDDGAKDAAKTAASRAGRRGGAGRRRARSSVALGGGDRRVVTSPVFLGRIPPKQPAIARVLTPEQLALAAGDNIIPLPTRRAQMRSRRH